MRLSSRYIVGVCIAILALILHIIGTASPQWVSVSTLTTHGNQDYDYEISRFGLFQECKGGDCSAFRYPTSDHRAAQAMAILACLSGAAGIAMAMGYSVMVLRGKTPMLLFRRIAGMCSLYATIFIVICVVLFRVKIYDDFKNDHVTMEVGYGLFLSSVGAFLFLVAGVLKIIVQAYELERFIVH